MRKLLLGFLFSLFIDATVNAQSEATVVYIEVYKKIAVDEMKRTGIPASITLAQGILESNSGESALAKKANNHFGIKCKSDWKGETFTQDDDSKNECFRAYPTAKASFIDHSNFLKTRPNYASLFQLDPVDDSAWAYGLKKAGYATAPDYPQKIMKVIDDYELSQYNFPELEVEDSIQLSKESSTVQLKKDTLKKSSITSNLNDTNFNNNTIIKIPITNKDTSIKLQIVKDSINQDNITLTKVVGIQNSANSPSLNSAPTPPNSIGSLVVEEKVHTKNKDSSVLISDTLKKQKDFIVLKKYPVQYPTVRFRINDVPALWIKEGTSYLEIAQNNNIELYKLFEYNEIKEADLVDEDQLVFLAPKKKTSSKKTHVVKEGETLYSISQMEGIQYKHLQLYNILLTENALKAGSTVLLFNPK